jgi:beta-glucosidase
MDSPAHALDTYPGTNGTLFYKEGLLVGYRWFDAKDIEPEFPFGFGLSYTTFEYSNLKLVPSQDTNGPVVTAEFEIANTGARAAAEGTERLQKDFPETGRKEDRLHPARPARLRLLRPGKNRLGLRSRRLQDFGWRLLTRHPFAGHLPPGANHG